jgi:hypothetical protein
LFVKLFFFLLMKNVLRHGREKDITKMFCWKGIINTKVDKNVPDEW